MNVIIWGFSMYLFFFFFLNLEIVLLKKRKHLINVEKTKAGPSEGDLCAETDTCDGHLGITTHTGGERGERGMQRGKRVGADHCSTSLSFHFQTAVFFRVFSESLPSPLGSALPKQELQQKPVQISTNHRWIFYFFILFFFLQPGVSFD